MVIGGGTDDCMRGTGGGDRGGALGEPSLFIIGGAIGGGTLILSVGDDASCTGGFDGMIAGGGRTPGNENGMEIV